MADVLIFTPQTQRNAEENLASFIDLCRNHLTAFGADLNFDENVWNVTNSVQLKSKGRQQTNCAFNTLGTCDDNAPVAMAEPFLSFAKSYIRYLFSLVPAKNLGNRLTALRSLEAALAEAGIAPNPVMSDAGAFNRAAQLVQARYAPSLAYRIGLELERLAEFFVSSHLVLVPLKWRNSIARPKEGNRVGAEADKRREEKLPSLEALDALPKMFWVATEPIDVLASSVASILCSAPDRINEVLLLPMSCEVHQDQEGRAAYGLRWWPAKGAPPMIKWIVPTMVSVVQEAISRIKKVTANAREVAKWYEDNPNRLYIPGHLSHLRQKEYLTFSEVATLIFEVSAKGAGREWCVKNKVPFSCVGRDRSVRFHDVEKAAIAQLPDGFPWLNTEVGLRYSEALFVTRRYELSLGRGTFNGVVDAVTSQQISDALGGRAEHGHDSSFSRLGFAASDGSPLKVSTHQFRHYLNTLAQAGGMSQLDIAKWSGRRDIRQNEVYDHVHPTDIIAKIRNAVGDLPETKEALSNLPARVIIRREEFLRLKIPTAHTTDYGYCVHDYTMSPCQLHMDCLYCEEQVCIKGEKNKTELLKQRLVESRKLLADAQLAMGQGYKGADRWITHHKNTVDRMEQLASILDDSTIPDGTPIQISGDSSVSRIEQAIERREQQLQEIKAIEESLKRE